MSEAARTRFYRVLEGGHPRTPFGWAVDVLLIALISTNVLAAILETVGTIHARFGFYFLWFEIVSVAVFSVEYAARVWVSIEDSDLRELGPVRARLRYMMTPLALIDLVAIAPVYLGMIFSLDLRWLRLLRLLRLFKLTRYWSALNLLYRVMRDEAQVIGAALFLLCVVMILAAGGIYIFEHSHGA